MSVMLCIEMRPKELYRAPNHVRGVYEGYSCRVYEGSSLRAIWEMYAE